MTTKKSTRIFVRSLSLVLALMMLVGVLPTGVFATNGDATEIPQTSEKTSPVVAVGEGYGIPGSKVELMVSIQNNPGVSAATLEIGCDGGLQLIGIREGAAFEPLDFTPPGKAPGQEAYTLPTAFGWDTVDQQATADGTLLTLTFWVPEDAVAGTSYTIDIVAGKSVLADENMTPMDCTMVDGTIMILEYLPGDVDGDGRIISNDVTKLRRYIAGGYGVEINELAADVNADGYVNSIDVTLIRRSLAGGWGVTLMPGLTECAHEPEAIAAKPASCLADGNIAYWRCTKCNTCFSDAEATTQISPESTVLSATGHTVVVDEAVAPDYENPGWTEGSHCSVCGEVIVAQQEISPLEAAQHSISYHNDIYFDLNDKEHTALFALPSIAVEDTRYKENEGKTLLIPQVDGYEFLGWFDKDGNRVPGIAKGETKDFTLYARWRLERYEITYKNAADNNNLDYYTVLDEITLTTPKWAGLEFAYWTDQNGETVTQIAKGTTGNIVLEANWRYAKNLAVSNPNKYTYIGGVMDSKSRYNFIYDIGTIENIVLDTKYVVKYGGGETIDRTEKTSYKVQATEAKTVSQTIANSVIQSEEWKNTSTWVSRREEGLEFGAKYCPEIEYAGIKAKLYEITGGWSEVEEENYTEEKVQIDSEVKGTELTDQTVSYISYLMENETESSVSVKLSPGTSPVGSYSYVRAADVKVYAIITYDPANGEYYLDIYSQVYRVHDRTLFELTGSEQYVVNIESCNQLDFEIPYAQIPENFYTVEYDANGGSGDMPKSVHELGQSSALLSNEFTRTGYTFVGWKTTADDSAALYPDASSIRDIAAAGETVTLYAHWTPISYTVVYDGNKPSSASSAVVGEVAAQNCTYDESFTIAANQYTLTGWTFCGWSMSATASYDSADICQPGDEKSNLTDKVEGTVTLYAVWKANTYNIVFHPNGYFGYTADMTCTYDQSYNLSNCGYTCTGWNFDGWSTSSSATGAQYGNCQTVKNLATGGTVHLYPVWSWRTKTVESSTANNVTITDYGHYGVYSCIKDGWSFEENYYTSIDLNELNPYMNDSYVFAFEVSIRCYEDDDGYQEFFLYNQTPPEITKDKYTYEQAVSMGMVHNVQFEHGGEGKDETESTHTFTFTVSGSKIRSSMQIRYDAWGDDNDDWKLCSTAIKVSVDPR